MSRAAAIEGFLHAAGWGAAVRTPLAGDASARRYLRLASGGTRAMLMDAPPASGLDVTPFLRVTAWLRREGFSAPEVFAADPAQGLVLLEDLGPDLFARLCAARPEREGGLYTAAVDLLGELQARPPPGARGGWSPQPYDMDALLREVLLVAEWYLPAVTGRAAPPELAAEYAGLAAEAFAPALAAPSVAVLRDYHAENLIWLPGRAGHARVGLLDYQDMLLGHPAYDLVSLIEDARRDLSPELRAGLLARRLAQSGAEPEGFIYAAHVLGAQRNLKILGLFTRLCRRDGKPGYLAHLPRVWAHMQADLSHPALAPLRAWVALRVPAPDADLRARIAAAA